MSRRAAVLLGLVLAFTGIAVIAGDQSDESKTSERETISFVVTKTDGGPAVQITVGDYVLITPKLTMHSKTGKDSVEIFAHNDKVRCMSSRGDKVTSASEIKMSLQNSGWIHFSQSTKP